MTSGEGAVRITLLRELDKINNASGCAVLGVAANADAATLRSAFLGITKAFHPSRYARHSPEIYRLANEVFLRYKATYEGLVSEGGRDQELARLGKHRPVRASAGPALRAEGSHSGPIPTIAASSTQGPTSYAVRSPRANPSGSIPTLSPAGAPTQPRAPKAPETSATATGSPRRTGPLPRISSPSLPRPAAATPAAPGGTKAPTAAATPVGDPFESAVDLCRRQLWREAKDGFHRLAVGDPHNRDYRAWMHYALAMAYLDEGRHEDARDELRRALDQDPTFQRAQRAFDALPAPQGGDKRGLFSRLFKR